MHEGLHVLEQILVHEREQVAVHVQGLPQVRVGKRVQVAGLELQVEVEVDHRICHTQELASTDLVWVER